MSFYETLDKWRFESSFSTGGVGRGSVQDLLVRGTSPNGLIPAEGRLHHGEQSGSPTHNILSSDGLLGDRSSILLPSASQMFGPRGGQILVNHSMELPSLSATQSLTKEALIEKHGRMLRVMGEQLASISGGASANNSVQRLASRSGTVVLAEPEITLSADLQARMKRRSRSTRLTGGGAGGSLSASSSQSVRQSIPTEQQQQQQQQSQPQLPQPPSKPVRLIPTSPRVDASSSATSSIHLPAVMSKQPSPRKGGISPTRLGAGKPTSNNNNKDGLTSPHAKTTNSNGSNHKVVPSSTSTPSKRGKTTTATAAPSSSAGSEVVLLRHTFNGVTKILYDDGRVEQHGDGELNPLITGFSRGSSPARGGPLESSFLDKRAASKGSLGWNSVLHAHLPDSTLDDTCHTATGKDAMTIDSINDGGMGELLMESHGGSTRIPSPPMPTVSPSDDFDLRPLTHNTSAVEDSPRDGFVPQRINNRGGATVFAEFDERHAPFSTGPLQEQHSDSGDLGAPLGHSSVFLTQTQMEGHNNNWGRNTATPRGFKSLNSTVTSTTMVLGGGVSSRHPRLDDDSCDFGSFACSDILRRGNAATANPDRPPSTADGDDVGVDDDDESGTKASTSLHPHPGSERVLREQAPSLFSIPLPEIREDGSVGHPELLPCGWTVYQLFRRLLEREEGSMRSKLSGLDIMRFMWKSSAASELIITFVWYVITRCRKAWLERLLIDQYYRLEALYQELFTQARKERLPQVSYLEQLVSELLMVVPEWREVEAEAERLAEVQLRRKSSRFLNLNQARPASNHSARGESSDGRVETAPAKPRSAFLARRQSIRGSIHDDLYQCDLQGFLEERGCATILRTPDLLSTGTLPEYTDVQELASALRSFVSTIQENVDLITYEERCFQRLSILFGQIFLELSSSEKDLILESYGLVVVRLTNFCLLFCFPNDSHAGIFGSEFRADMHRLFQYWCSGLVVAHVMVKNWPVPKLLDHHDMEVRQKQEKMQRFMSHRYAEYLVPKDGTEWYVDMPEGMAFPGDVCGGDGGISNIMSSTQFGDGAEIIAAAATDGSAGSTPQRQHAPHLPTALATLPAVYSSGTTAPHRLSPMHPPGSLTNLAEFSITSPHASHSPGRAESTTPTLTSPHRRGKDGGAEPRTSMTTFSGGSPARDTSSGGPPTSNTTSITAYPAVKALSMLAAGHHRRSSVNMTVDDIRAEQLISEQLNATMSLPSRARSCSKVGADLIQMGAESVARSGGGGGETSAERLPWALFRSRSSVAVKSRNNNNYNRSEENSKSSPGPHSPLNRYRSGFSAAFQSSSRAGGGGIDANNESVALTSTMRAKKTQPLGSAVHESVDVDVVNSEYRLAAEFQRYTKHAGMLVNELDRQLTVQHQKQRRKDQITLRLAEQLRNLSDLQRITSGGGPNEWEEGGAGASPSPHHQQQQQQQQNDVADGRERRSPSPPNLGSTRRAQFLPSIVTEKSPPSANNHVSLRRGGAGAGTVAGCRRSPIVVEKERRSSRSTSAVAPADPLTQTLAAPPSRGSTASPSLTARCTPGASPSPEVGSWPKAGSPGEKMMMMMSGDNSSGEVFPLLHVEHTTPSQSEHEHSSGISSMSRSQKNNNFSHGRSPPHPIIVEVNVAEQQQHPAHGDQQQQQSPPPIASPLTARFVESPPEHRWSPQPRSGCTSPQAQLATPTPDGVAPTPTPTPPTMMAEMMDVDAPGVLQKRSTPPPPPPTQAPSMLPTPARSVNRRPPSSARQVQQEREEERSRGLRRRARLATSAEVPARPTLVRVAQELKDSKMTLNGENATASSLVHPSARRPGVAGDGDGCTNNNNATKCGGEDDDDEMPKIDYKAAAATTSMARGGPENTAVGLMRRFVMGESVNQSLLMAYPLAVCEDSIQAYVADTVGMRYPNVPLLPTCAAAKHLRVMARRQQHQRRRSGHRSTSLSVGSFTRDAPGGATDAPNVAAPTAMVATTSSSSTPIPASTAVATTTTTTTTSPPPAKAHVPASPTHSSPRARDGRILSGESLTPGGGRRAAAVADMEILAPNRTLLPTASPFIKHYAKEVLGMDLDRDDHTTTSGANNTALVVATTPTTRAAMLEAPFAQTPLGSPPRDGISWSGAGANGSITSTPSSSHAHTTKSVFRGEGRPTRNKTHLLVIPPEEGLQRPLLYGELRKEAMQRERSLMDDLGTIAKRENISRMQYDRDRLRMTSLVDRTRSEFSTTRFQQQARRQLELAIAAKAQEDAAEGESTARVQGSGSG